MEKNQVIAGKDKGLKRGSLNYWHVAFISLAYFYLAPALYLNMGFMETSAGGPVMPLVFLLITIAIIPTAISFAVMNNRRPSAGSGYTWLWETTKPSVGLWLGWVMVTLYITATALYPPAFSAFFNTSMSYIGIHISTWTSVLGGVLCLAIGAYLSYRNIRVSALIIGALMVFEATFVLILSIVIVVQGGVLGHFTSIPFNPLYAKNGFSGLGIATIFAFLSIAGVDAVAPVAEETRTPRALIPLVTISTALIAGLYWVITSYGFAVAVPVSEVAHYVSQGQITAVYPIAQKYIGPWAILVPITGFTASLASLGASSFAASRLLYALSRDGFAPRPLGKLHPSHRTPWAAEIFVFVISLLLFVCVTLWQGGPENAYAYLGEIFVFFVLITYIFVNLANLLYHFGYKKGRHWFLTFFAPLIGIAIDIWILIYGFFYSELSLPWKSGSSIVWISVLWALVGAVWAMSWKRKCDLSAISLAKIDTLDM